MEEKHPAPWICKMKRKLFGASPSAILAKCSLGNRGRCRKCHKCEENTAEKIVEAFTNGIERAEKERQNINVQFVQYQDWRVFGT